MTIYVVTDTANTATRLIEAPNPAQALRHVTSQQFAVRAATAALVAKLMGAGIKVESLAADAQPEPQPEGF